MVFVSPFLLLTGCIVAPGGQKDSDADGPGATDDTAAAAPISEERLRGNYEIVEGLDFADGTVTELPVNNAIDPEATHTDINCFIGRYIGLAAYSGADEPGRICPVGTGFADLDSVPVSPACTQGGDEAWFKNVPCAVNSSMTTPACIGAGFLVRPLAGDTWYRLRIVVDDFVAEGDFLGGITFEYQLVDAGD